MVLEFPILNASIGFSHNVRQQSEVRRYDNFSLDSVNSSIEFPKMNFSSKTGADYEAATLFTIIRYSVIPKHSV